MRQTFAFLMTGLTLVALYIVVTNAGGVARVVSAGGGTVSGVYKTLQGR